MALAHLYSISVFAALTISGCGNADRIYIDVSGPIDSQSEKIADKLSRNAVLRIESAGGDAEKAINIGFKVVETGSSVYVNNYCISSCANYIALVSDELVLEEGAFIGIHHNVVSFEKFLVTKGKVPSVELRLQAERARSLFSISRHQEVLEFLDISFSLLGPVDVKEVECLKTQPGSILEDEKCHSIIVEKGIIIPDYEVLRDLRSNVTFNSSEISLDRVNRVFSCELVYQGSAFLLRADGRLELLNLDKSCSE